jgi:hypothetical protein
MVAEPVTILSTALTVVGGAVLHAIDVLQVPDEVASSVAAMRACEKNLGTLIALSKEHGDLLVKRPVDAASVEHTIERAWADLQAVKPVLERCGQNALSTKTTLKRRLQWKFMDQKKYHLLAAAVSRNDVDVRDHIKKLEQMVYFNPLEKLAETAKEEDRRRRMEIDQVKARREIDGFGFLDPVGSPAMAQIPGQISTQARRSPSPAPLMGVLYPPYIVPAGTVSSQSVHSGESSLGMWSCDSRTLTSSRSTATLSRDSTLTGSSQLTGSLAGLISLSPDDTPPWIRPATTISKVQTQQVQTAASVSLAAPVLNRRATR